MILATAQVESSFRTHVRGDRSKEYPTGKSWGLYQFQRDRWKESDGDPKMWGRADWKEQTKIFLLALLRYHRNADEWHETKKWCAREKFNWLVNYHNIGHGDTEKTTHNTKVWKEFLRWRQALRNARLDLQTNGPKPPKKK